MNCLHCRLVPFQCDVNIVQALLWLRKNHLHRTQQRWDWIALCFEDPREDIWNNLNGGGGMNATATQKTQHQWREFKGLLKPGRQTNSSHTEEEGRSPGQGQKTQTIIKWRIGDRPPRYQENSGKLASSLGFKSSWKPPPTVRSSYTLQKVKYVKHLSSHLNSASLKMSFSCLSTIPSFLSPSTVDFLALVYCQRS